MVRNYNKLSSSFFVGLVDVSLKYMSKTEEGRLKASEHLSDKDFLGRKFCEFVNTCNVEDFTVNEAGFDFERFNLVGEFLCDLSGSNRIFCAGSNSSHTFENVCEITVTGILASSLGKSVFNNRVFNACFAEFCSECCVIFNGDTFVLNDNARGSFLQLFGQISNNFLFGFKNLCTRHDFTTLQ